MRRLALLFALLACWSPLSAQGPVLGPRLLETSSSPATAAGHRGVKKGLLIGALTGAVAGGAFGAWFAHAICDAAECGDDALRGLGYGAVLGAVAGAGVGAAIAALSSKAAPVREEGASAASQGYVLRAAPIVTVPGPARRPALGLTIVLHR
jgi:hypothetical protein